jgi:chromosome segregation ATPase
MNNARRKDINAIMADIEKLEPLASKIQELIEHFKEECENIVDAINDVENDEQEAFDALPESLRQGERGLNMEDAITQLQDAKGCLEWVEDFEGWSTDEVIGFLDAAKGV